MIFFYGAGTTPKSISQNACGRQNPRLSQIVYTPRLSPRGWGSHICHDGGSTNWRRSPPFHIGQVNHMAIVSLGRGYLQFDSSPSRKYAVLPPIEPTNTCIVSNLETKWGNKDAPSGLAVSAANCLGQMAAAPPHRYLSCGENVA